jgi:hypothetical protein
LNCAAAEDEVDKAELYTEWEDTAGDPAVVLRKRKHKRLTACRKL